MIAAWQKARNQPATGFLTASQQQQLQREAAAAITKFDEDEKKKEEDKKKAEEEAKKKADEAAKAAAAPATPPAATPAAPPGSLAAYDGTYGASLTALGMTRQITVTVGNGAGSGTYQNPACGGTGQVSLKISATGDVTGSGTGFNGVCQPATFRLYGSAADGQLKLTISPMGGTQFNMTLIRGAAPAAAAAPAPTAGAASATFGGSIYLSSYRLGGITAVSVALSVSGSTAAAEFSSACGSVKATMTVAADGSLSGIAKLPADAKSCAIEDFTLNGKMSGESVQFAASSSTGKGSGTLNRRP
jgi:hypothetical protein